ncbi:hypothetical protein V6N11_035302 [Hibiscus sabdariffa]|uniref:Uncharacterized protein n=1 Tax=Hibiscus sabdariffa TaxID=183260 RepID=A0ABR2QZV3_9ROSI
MTMEGSCEKAKLVEGDKLKALAFHENSTAPVSGLALGCPPDASSPIQVPVSLERVEHPDIGEEEQVMKKSKGEGDVVMDVSDIGFNGFPNGMAGIAGDAVMAVSGDSLGGGDGNMGSKPSFRDMLAGRLGEGLVKTQLSELDVDMEAGDVQITSVDGTPRLNASGSTTEERGTTDELGKSDTLEKFGPWMQVMGRRGRKGVSNRVLHNSEPQHRGVALKPQDSGKFSVLANLEREVAEDTEPPVSDFGLGAESAVVQAPSAGAVTHMGQSLVVGGSVLGEGLGVSCVGLFNGSDLASKVSHDNANEVVARFEVASSERVVPVRGALNPKNHMVVRVLDDGREKGPSVGRNHKNSVGDSNLKPKVMSRKSLHTAGDKKSVANRRKSNGRSSDKVALGEWIGELDNKLVQNGKSLDSSTAVEQVEISENPMSSSRWRDNMTFATEM